MSTSQSPLLLMMALIAWDGDNIDRASFFYHKLLKDINNLPKAPPSFPTKPTNLIQDTFTPYLFVIGPKSSVMNSNGKRSFSSDDANAQGRKSAKLSKKGVSSKGQKLPRANTQRLLFLKMF